MIMNTTESAIDFDRMDERDRLAHSFYPIEFHRGARDHQLRLFSAAVLGVLFHGLDYRSGSGEAYTRGWRHRESVESEVVR